MSVSLLEAPAGPVKTPRDRLYGLLVTLLVVFALGYIVQVLTPLRLNGDAIAYLRMAASAADGEGFYADMGGHHFPVGYPAVVMLLDRAGLAASWSIVAANLLFLAVGLVAAAALLRRWPGIERRTVLIISAAFLASFAVIKHATLPLSESAFFAALMVTLLLLSEVHSRTGWRQRGPLLAAALVFAWASWMLRSVGVVLGPAILLAVLPPIATWGAGYKALRSRPRVAIGLAGGVLGIVALMLWLGINSDYFDQFTDRYGRGEWSSTLRWTIMATCREWGEIFLNMPVQRLRALVPFGRDLIMIAGTVGLVAVLVGIWRHRRSFGPAEALVITYLALLLVWPSDDARFWIPVLPLLLGYAWLAVAPLARWRLGRYVLGLYLAWFLLLGVLALGFSTRLSLSSAEEFAATYGTGTLRPAYEAALGTRDLDGLKWPAPQAYRMIIRYGRADQVRSAAPAGR